MKVCWMILPWFNKVFIYLILQEDDIDAIMGGLLSWDMASSIQWITHNCRNNAELKIKVFKII